MTLSSLIYLKLTSVKSVYSPVFEGLFWEQFIRIRFPQRKNFEFYFTYSIEDNTVIHILSRYFEFIARGKTGLRIAIHNTAARIIAMLNISEYSPFNFKKEMKTLREL